MPDTATERLRVYLNKVHFKGFKSIEDLTIDTQKGLNILIGKNGAGKSNFLEALYRAIRDRFPITKSFSYVLIEFISDDNYSFIVETAKAPLQIDKNILNDDTETAQKLSIDGKIVFNNIKEEYWGKKINFKNNRPFVYQGIAKNLFRKLVLC